jgi:hypothetical protein
MTIAVVKSFVNTPLAADLKRPFIATARRRDLLSVFGYELVNVIANFYVLSSFARLPLLLLRLLQHGVIRIIGTFTRHSCE